MFPAVFRRICFVIVLALISKMAFCANTSSLVITLQVLDNKTHAPVAWATVFNKKDGYGVIADKNGLCEIRVQHAGADTFVVSSIGYSDQFFVPSVHDDAKTVNLYLEPFYVTGDSVLVSAIRRRTGMELIREFKKNFSRNYAAQPFSGSIYAKIHTRQDTVLVRDVEYISAFHCPTGYAGEVRTIDTLIRSRFHTQREDKVIPNPTTSALVTSNTWSPFLRLDIIKSFLDLDQKNTRVTSVSTMNLNGTGVYKITAYLTEPLIYNHVSRVDLELYLSAVDFSLIKYKTVYKVLFNNLNGASTSLDLKANTVPSSAAVGFRYDSIIFSRQVYYKKTEGIYTPFYCLTEYRVNDEQTAIHKKGRFEEIREFFIYNTQLESTGNKEEAVKRLKTFVADQQMADDRFWLHFSKPDRARIAQFLSEED